MCTCRGRNGGSRYGGRRMVSRVSGEDALEAEGVVGEMDHSSAAHVDLPLHFRPPGGDGFSYTRHTRCACGSESRELCDT